MVASAVVPGPGGLRQDGPWSLGLAISRLILPGEPQVSVKEPKTRPQKVEAPGGTTL